jgi:hypothetical protein
LATQIKHAQNVVEDRVKTERRRRAAAALTQVRQDKLLELLVTQLCENALPWLAFRHIERQSDGIPHSSLVSEATLARCAFALKFSAEKTCNQLINHSSKRRA